MLDKKLSLYKTLLHIELISSPKYNERDLNQIQQDVIENLSKQIVNCGNV